MAEIRYSNANVIGYKMKLGATLTALRFVKLSSGTIEAIAVTTDKPWGVLLKKTARIDIKVPVQVDGVCDVEVGTAGVTEGTEVKIDSAGCVVDSAHASGDSIVGQAEKTKTDGQYVSVKLAFCDVA